VKRPADLCRQWRHFLLVGPERGEAPHVEQVAPGEPASEVAGGSEVLSEQADDVVAPGVAFLLGEDRSTDRPVQQHQLGVDGAGGALSGCTGLGEDHIAQLRVVSGRRDVLAGRASRRKITAISGAHDVPLRAAAFRGARLFVGRNAADSSRASPARERWCMYFIVVCTSAWPIHAWTWTIVAWSMAIEPNVWQVMEAQRPQLRLLECLLVAAA
jgi:hypothetical protein